MPLARLSSPMAMAVNAHSRNSTSGHAEARPGQRFYHDSAAAIISCESTAVMSGSVRGASAPPASSQRDDVIDAWRRADAVCFDVDSTVTPVEGIDELAKFAGVGQQVAEWTRKAMSGSDSTLTFRKCLYNRLKIIAPSKQMIDSFVEAHPPKLTPYIKALVTELVDRDIDVYLVSGGFRCLIEPLADMLNLPRECVYANRLKFYYGGEYAGFDEGQPTSESGGKSLVCEELKRRNGYETLIMVGDGATDLEAESSADAFIGFGGNQIRDRVKRESKWFVMSFKELIDELPPLQSESDSSPSD